MAWRPGQPILSASDHAEAVTVQPKNEQRDRRSIDVNP